MTKEKLIANLEMELQLTIPYPYKDYLLRREGELIYGMPLLGFGENGSISIGGAVTIMRTFRPDMKSFLPIRIVADRLLCLDLTEPTDSDPQLVEIDLGDDTPPTRLKITLTGYLRESDNSRREIKQGLERIKKILAFHNSRNKNFAHTDDRIPFKARDWRIHRCCVHDLVVGLVAFRFNESFYGIEVDTFLSTDHPDYEEGHGAKALLSLILSDAYRNGSSMEIKFAGSMPKTVKSILIQIGLKPVREKEGVITHEESVNLFAILLGIQNETIEKIRNLESKGEATLQGICYLINSRIWTIDEINWLILNAERSKAVVFGRDLPENRIPYLESLSLARSVICFSKLKEKIQQSSTFDTNDIDVSIKGLLFEISTVHDSNVDWLVTGESLEFNETEIYYVLSRPRQNWHKISEQVKEDIFTIQAIKGHKIILYSSDITAQPGFKEIVLELSKDADISILLAPFSAEEMNEEATTKMKNARKYRT